MSRSRRDEIIEFLEEERATLRQVAVAFGGSVKRARVDLKHIRRSLKSAGKRLCMTPVECHTCGASTVLDKLGNPRRCPACGSKNIERPRFYIEPKSDENAKYAA